MKINYYVNLLHRKEKVKCDLIFQIFIQYFLHADSKHLTRLL